MKRYPKLLAIGACLIALSSPSQAELVRYQTQLLPEVPGATGTGFATADYDPLAHTLAISSTWSGLSGPTTVAHIHCCTPTPNTGTAGVAVTPGTLPGFPVGVSAGSYAVVLDLTESSTFTTAFVTNFAGGVVENAEEALIAGFDAQVAYFNIHSSTFPGGEIRGFLEILEVPEPAGLALALLGFAGLGWSRRK